VLDEMDAPLDESNINRFIKVLERFRPRKASSSSSHPQQAYHRQGPIFFTA